MDRGLRGVVAGLALVTTTVLGATGLDAIRSGEAATSGAESPGDAVVSDTVPGELSQAFRQAAERALPSVVYVEVEAVGKSEVSVPAPFEGTPWEEFFRRDESSPEPRQGSGSGFIIREDGYILTNDHVVADAKSVTVVLKDGREFAADIVGRDPNTDVAVLKIDAEGLPAVQMADSDAVEVGDWVVALGYPLHLGSTATAGIVSAKGKSLGILSRNEEASAPLEHFIQTDAAINPGNSGGVLIDLQGRALGMNSAIASPTGYYSGYGFAIPINLARRVAEDIIEDGVVERPRLGVGIADVDPADAEVYGLERPSGVEIVQVQDGTAAERAGLQLGDVIVAVDGEPVEDSGGLMERLARQQPGERVELTVVRYGERHDIEVELGTFEPAVQASGDSSDEAERGVAVLGFEAAELTPRLAQRMRFDEAGGVVVVDVAQNGPARRAGVAPGMRIERVNGNAIEEIGDLERTVRELSGGAVVSLVVRLPDDTRTIVNYRLRE